MNHYLLMWSSTELMYIEDAGYANREMIRWEKEQIFQVLQETKIPNKPNIIPLKQLILQAARHSEPVEIYEYLSKLSASGIKQEFLKNLPQITTLIRMEGEEVYTSKSKHEND